MSLDGVPYVGRYGKRATGLYVATGFNKSWQGQSQERSARLYLSAQPMWGHRGAVGVRSPAADAST